MQKKTLAILAIALLGAPLIIFYLATIIRGYLPPSEPSHKMPHQFEEAFNERMAAYGMSLDLSSARYNDSDGDGVKTVPVQCADGSEITCTIYTTSPKKKSLIILVEFEQPYDGEIPANLQPLFEMLLQVFETPLYLEPDKSYHSHSMSYNEAVEAFRTFAKTDMADTVINVSAIVGDTDYLILKRERNEEAGQDTLLLRLEILTITIRTW